MGEGLCLLNGEGFSFAFRWQSQTERERRKAPSPFGRKSLSLGKHLQRRR
jgi:outer membrane biogenesis lipoprotein LolB